MRRLPSILAFCGLLTGCPAGLDQPAELPPLDAAYFRCQVQPVLVKSCSAFACHGDVRRFFRVFGRNRLRYGLPEEKRNSLLAPIEIAHNFDSARAYVDTEAPESSLLLTKALDIEAGGSWHGGAIEYGQGNVILSKDDTDYQTLLAWTLGAKEDPQCVEPGSDQ